MLFSKEVNCNVVNYWGSTPLFMACGSHNKKAVKLLLEHGANPNIPNMYKMSPLVKLLESTQEGDIEILKLPTQYGTDVSIIFRYAGYRMNIILFLLERLGTGFKREICLFLKELLNSGGASVDYLDEQGANALHIACFNNDIECAQILLEYGCDYKQRDERHQLPVDKFTNPLMRRQFLDQIEKINCR